MYLKILHCLFNILVGILVKFFTPVDNYVALIILISHHTIIIAGFCQLIAILIIHRGQKDYKYESCDKIIPQVL